jgi:hypothetical protein
MFFDRIICLEFWTFWYYHRLCVILLNIEINYELEKEI